jgi:hypothetical protein
MSNELPDDAFDGIKWEMQKPNKELLSNKETTKFLNTSQNALDKIRKKGELPFHIHGGMYFYLRSDCVDWILKNQPGRLTKK